MMKALFSYLLALMLFTAMDLLWLGKIARSFYQRHLGPWLRAETHWPAAIAFYLIFIGGLWFFAIRPAIQTGDLRIAGGYGAIYGLCTYATYELTNHATHREWPAAILLPDMLWGTVLSAVVALLTVFFIGKIL
ncbi:MAG: DUF2177 family protein [Saprospiraceae bacterium]|nr:DUF2177 family protein [Saprospiraceae bacterium]